MLTIFFYHLAKKKQKTRNSHWSGVCKTLSLQLKFYETSAKTKANVHRCFKSLPKMHSYNLCNIDIFVERVRLNWQQQQQIFLIKLTFILQTGRKLGVKQSYDLHLGTVRPSNPAGKSQHANHSLTKSRSKCAWKETKLNISNKKMQKLTHGSYYNLHLGLFENFYKQAQTEQ